MQKLSDQKREEWAYINTCFEAVNRQFDIHHVNNPIITRFHMFKSKRKPKYFNSWMINKGNFQFVLCLIEYEIEWHEATPFGGFARTAEHKYFFGYLHMNTSFGLSYIKPETMLDKINELANPIEIDFPDDRSFSRKFYVLSKNKEQLESALKPELKKYLIATKNLELEFRNRACLFRLPKAIDLEETIRLCEIGLKLDEIINTNV